MAYTDTGLGWYANSDWLTDTTGDIGEISTSGSDFPPPSYQYPYQGPFSNYPKESPGFCWGYRGNEGWLSEWQYDNFDTAFVFFAMIDGHPYRITNVQGTRCQWHSSGGLGGIFAITSAVPGYSGWYEAHDTLAGYSNYAPNFVFSTIADAMTAILSYTPSPTIIASFSKSTSGYSVTCICKWRAALDGDVYCSPVLISSIENNTLYTRNSATPSVTATQHSFQGRTFYMRKAPLDVVEGSETITADFPVLDYSESPPVTNDLLFALIASASKLGVGVVPEDDPYSGAGESGPDAGDPTFDFTSEDIPVPSIPSIGAYNTGFINMYKPTLGDLQGLAHYLWSGSFDPENLRKLIANPMDAILGLHIVPTTASHPAGSSATLYVGNIDTQLSMLRLTEQYYELDCGTINIEPKWGAYLDYAPYSKLTLYLPYIGFVPISPDDCMGGSINVKYHVDVLSGACCVYVYCTSNRGADSHVLYSYTGACACDCPVTEGQYTNAILGILNIAGSVAGAISGAMTGNAGGITGGIESAANAALSMVKPDISRSGSFGGSAGLMGIQYPYLVLTVPRMCTPGDQQKQEGYPSFVTKAMGQLVGLNRVQVKRLEGMTCTANETEEILTLLEGGAIF